MSGDEFRKEREKYCKDRQVFARVSGVPIRTLASFELGETKHPRKYDQLVDTLRRYQRGEISDATPLPSTEGEVEVIDLAAGVSATLRSEDYANLGDYRRAREGLLRLAQELRSHHA